MSWLPTGREHPRGETEVGREERDAPYYAPLYNVHLMAPIVCKVICEWDESPSPATRNQIVRGFPDAGGMARATIDRYGDQYGKTWYIDVRTTMARTVELAIVQWGFEYRMWGERSTGPQVMSGILARALVFCRQLGPQQAQSAPSTPEQPTQSISRLTPERENISRESSDTIKPRALWTTGTGNEEMAQEDTRWVVAIHDAAVVKRRSQYVKSILATMGMAAALAGWRATQVAAQVETQQVAAQAAAQATQVATEKRNEQQQQLAVTKQPQQVTKQPQQPQQQPTEEPPQQEWTLRRQSAYGPAGPLFRPKTRDQQPDTVTKQPQQVTKQPQQPQQQPTEETTLQRVRRQQNAVFQTQFLCCILLDAISNVQAHRPAGVAAALAGWKVHAQNWQRHHQSWYIPRQKERHPKDTNKEHLRSVAAMVGPTTWQKIVDLSLEYT